MKPAISGTAIRPLTGPYRCGTVRPGQRVPWHTARPIIDVMNLFTDAGYTVYILGDDFHLRGCGDHAPWSTGKLLGYVYACDVMVAEHSNPSLFQQWLLGVLRSDVDTTWVDFINYGGRQYNFAGVDVGASPDQHWHLSVNVGCETLFADEFLAEVRLFLGIPPVSPVKGFLMALTDKEQADIAFTCGVSDAAHKNGIGPIHARLTTIENGIVSLANAIVATNESLRLLIDELASKVPPATPEKK